MKGAVQMGNVLPIALLIFVVVGCGSTNRENTGTQSKPASSKPSILVQNEPKGKTGVYQQDLDFIPTLMVDGKASASDHSFGIYSMASYSGKSPKCEVKSLALSMSHSSPDVHAWRFPAKASAAAVIDGEIIPLKVYSQLPYKMPDMAKYMKNPEASEALIIAPDCALYKKFAKARTVEFRVANASFALLPDGVSNFAEFAKAIGY